MKTEKHIQTGYHRFLAYLDEQTIQPSIKKDNLTRTSRNQNEYRQLNIDYLWSAGGGLLRLFYYSIFK